MKRTLAIMFCLILLLSMTIPVTATSDTAETADSTCIPQELLDLYDREDAIFLCIFECFHLDFLKAAGTVDNLINYITPDYYVMIHDNGKTEYIYRSINYNTDRTYNKHVVAYDSYSQQALQFYMQNELAYHLGSDVQILQAYLLRVDFDESLIIYRTNKGDYVYFNHPQISPCLFTFEDFVSYRHFLYEVNSIIISKEKQYNICDLSKYTLNSPDFDPNADAIPWVPANLLPISCIVVSLLIVTTVILITVINRKKHKERQM